MNIPLDYRCDNKKIYTLISLLWMHVGFGSMIYLSLLLYRATKEDQAVSFRTATAKVDLFVVHQ
jgi:hypothetical protein